MYCPCYKSLELQISKTRSGHGRKRSSQVTELYRDLCSDFEHLRRCRVKFNTNLLLLVALWLIHDLDSDAYGPTHTDPRSEKMISDHVSKKCVKRSMPSN